MKRKTLIIALSSIFLLGGCLNNLVPWGKDEEEEIEKLTLHLSMTENTLKVGEKFTLTLLDQNNKERNDLADWSQSTEDYVTRDNKGEITAYNIGEVDIVATVNDYLKEKYSIPPRLFRQRSVHSGTGVARRVGGQSRRTDSRPADTSEACVGANSRPLRPRAPRLAGRQ